MYGSHVLMGHCVVPLPVGVRRVVLSELLADDQGLFVGLKGGGQLFLGFSHFPDSLETDGQVSLPDGIVRVPVGEFAHDVPVLVVVVEGGGQFIRVLC